MRYVLIFVITVFLSCSDDDSLNLDSNIVCSGTSSVTKNSNTQTMNICMGVDFDNTAFGNRYYISLSRKIDNDNDESLVFSRMKPILDNQDLGFRDFNPNTDGAVASYLTSFQQDILNDKYDVDTTKTDNFLIIDSYDENRNEISGRFNVTLNLTRDGDVGSTPPDQVVFENGTFTTKVNPAWFQ